MIFHTGRSFYFLFYNILMEYVKKKAENINY